MKEVQVGTDTITWGGASFGSSTALIFGCWLVRRIPTEIHWSNGINPTPSGRMSAIRSVNRNLERESRRAISKIVQLSGAAIR